MAFIDKMREYSMMLSKSGFVAIIPEEDDWSNITEHEINNYKRKVSKRHFDKITDSDTHAILVLNETKNGVSNYIGANTFAEIAIAFYFGKKIYVLHDIFSPYKDELLAWGAVALNGNLCSIS